MTTRTEPWPAGTPCWVDYGAVDVDAAVGFYSEVLGWTPETADPEHGGYVMCTVRGHDAAGIGPSTTPGVPSAWVTYLASTDADATAAAATEAGGMVLAEPFEVVGLGRMAIVADPQGAVFGVWQALGRIGSAIVNEPGGLTWNDAAHPDPAAARTFYARVFGYRYQALPGAGDVYRTFSVDGGHPLGGMGGLPAEGVPAHWLTYFAVADADAAVAVARRRGASVGAGPFDTEFGRIATLTDPWGATFAVMGGGAAA
ncbi:VOC family protein [Aquipuribacter sp. MA13-6]|uniref:VOC family protein n=1 Tax=unclassified Aquipuribacter TaxID=2635084 RepID=UPI003EEA1ED5